MNRKTVKRMLSLVLMLTLALGCTLTGEAKTKTKKNSADRKARMAAYQEILNGKSASPVIAFNIKDINGDGVEELLLSYNEPEVSPYPLGLFTWSNGATVCVSENLSVGGLYYDKKTGALLLVDNAYVTEGATQWYNMDPISGCANYTVFSMSALNAVPDATGKAVASPAYASSYVYGNYTVPTTIDDISGVIKNGQLLTAPYANTPANVAKYCK